MLLNDDRLKVILELVRLLREAQVLTYKAIELLSESNYVLTQLQSGNSVAAYDLHDSLVEAAAQQMIGIRTLFVIANSAAAANDVEF